MGMSVREQRGMVIAALCRIEKKGGVYLVPSQSGNGGLYTVCPDPEKPHCSCKDHEQTGGKCKHIFAVEFAVRRERNPDGSETISQSVTVTETVRPTYRQDWPAYNAAQQREKEKFVGLLRDLCNGVVEPPRPKVGRPRIPYTDAIFAAVFKVYSTVSARRFMTDLRDAHEKGYIGQVPCFNSVLGCLEDPAITPVLRSMIVESSRPLAAVEVDFAVDSSGFTTSRFIRWFDHKYGGERRKHEWVKVHLTCGVKTNIVTAVVIGDKDAADTCQLPEMVKTTAENFTLHEFLADKAYGSLENYDAIYDAGATPFIPFKTNHTGAGGGLWAKMFHYFNFRRDEFLGHYHKRSNVESTFSAIKRLFGDALRAKSDTAMVNEALAKVLCFNITCLIHEMYELGIEPAFWGAGPAPLPTRESAAGKAERPAQA